MASTASRASPRRFETAAPGRPRRRSAAHAVALEHAVRPRLVDVVGHGQRLVDGRRPRRHDQHVLDGHLLAGVLAAAEQVDGQPRQRGAGPRRSCRRNGCRAARHVRRRTARAKASDTARMALAPSRDLLGVPSSSIRARSSSSWVSKSRPARARVDLAVDVGDGLAAAQPAVAMRVAVAQLVRFGARRWRPRTAPTPTPAAPPASSQARPNGGAAAAVENLRAAQAFDSRHGLQALA